MQTHRIQRDRWATPGLVTLLLLVVSVPIILTGWPPLQIVGGVTLLLALLAPALGKARPVKPSWTVPVRARNVPPTLDDAHEEALARILLPDAAQRYLLFEENLIRTLLEKGLSRDAYAKQVQAEAVNYLNRHGDLSLGDGYAIAQRTMQRALQVYDAMTPRQRPRVTAQQQRPRTHRSAPSGPP